MSVSRMIVGSYTDGHKREGLYVFDLNTDTGELTRISANGETEDPASFVVLQDRNLLIVANEKMEDSYFSSFSIDRENGKLSLISKISVPGYGTCHVSVSPDGEWVFGSNYHTGNLVWTRISKTGEFIGPVNTIWYEDKSINPDRQTQSYIHSTIFINGVLHVVNLGGDIIYRYHLDSETGELTPCKKQPQITVPAGEGPRWLFMHPDEKYVYLLNEVGNSIIPYEICEDSTLKEHGITKLLSKDLEMDCRANVIEFSENGEKLFTGVREYDANMSLDIDKKTGELSNIKIYPSHGREERTFAFSPDYKLVLMNNQFSGELVICRFNRETNEIGMVVNTVKIPYVSFTKFLD